MLRRSSLGSKAEVALLQTALHAVPPPLRVQPSSVQLIVALEAESLAPAESPAHALQLGYALVEDGE